VEFSDWNGDYITQVYDNASDLDAGADIILLADSTYPGIDASLANALAVEPPVIVGLGKIGGNDWLVRYVGTVGTEYILQEAASMTNTWGNVGSPFTCQAGTNEVPWESSASILFWRLHTFP
jgi:hypothetical protein